MRTRKNAPNYSPFRTRKPAKDSSMKKYALIFAVVFIGFLAWYFFVDHGRSEGEAAIRKIEKFRQDNHRLPSSLREVGLPDSEEGPIYYKRIDNQNYCIWYEMRMTLGESVTYSSATKKWGEAVECVG
jgi:hypothetical protein